MLIIISGSSGVGKNTIINRLFEESSKLALLPTMTTRAMRPGESQNNPYRFVSKDEFLSALDAGEMLEYCEIHGNLYGTNRVILEEMQSAGKVLIKDIDVEGTVNLMKALPSVVSIYLKPKSREVLEERLRGRGEEQIELRLKRYEYEESMAHHYKYVLINDKIEDTLSEIRAIVRSEAEAQGIESPI